MTRWSGGGGGGGGGGVVWVWWVGVMAVVVGGTVIPPPWVNQTTNPCAAESWQLLYWPKDGSCHRIFTQGPCGETLEFYYDVMSGRGRCRCPRGSLFHSPTQRCFPHYSRGPCPPRQYVDRKENAEEANQQILYVVDQRREEREVKMAEGIDMRTEDDAAKRREEEAKRREEEVAEKTRKMQEEEAKKNEEELERKRKMREEGMCRKFGNCPPGQVFWPATRDCYQYHTRGPCLKGALLYVNPTTGMPECGCERSVMFSNYWPLTGLCFELFQRGPCPAGHIFLYNATRGVTECGCSEALVTNYHAESGGCYELDQRGPCPPGHIFTFKPSTMTATCTCRPQHALHPPTGACYHLYTRGPCQKGHFFTPSLSSNTTIEARLLQGQCQVYPCSGPRRYHPATDSCHRLGWRGPCQDGRLFIYHEDAPLVGDCGCLEELAGYWQGDGRCYEVGSRGPCPPNQILAYSKSNAASFCACDLRKGFVRWHDNQCYRLDTKGPCHLGQILVLPRGPRPAPTCITPSPQINPEGHHFDPSPEINPLNQPFNPAPEINPNNRHFNPTPEINPQTHHFNSVVQGRHLLQNTTVDPTTTTPSSERTRTIGRDGEVREGLGRLGQGRMGRSMGDTEVWGGLESLVPPGHYFTGRPDGRPGLTPWWGQNPTPHPTQASAPG